MKRGGYADKRYVLKFRAGQALFHEIRDISQQKDASVALVLRELVAEALTRRNAELNHVSDV